MTAAQSRPEEPNEKPVSPQPVPTIHTTSPLVLVDVVVTDKQGMPIHGLTAKDFHLFEGKDEQQISTFEEHRGVAASPAVITAALQADTYTNRRLSAQNSPLCVILLDSLNTAMSDQSFARFQLLKLAQSLPAGSRVAVFRLGAKLTMLQGFNEDTAKLIEMLKSSKADPQMGPFYNDADMSQALSAPDLTAGMGGSRAAGAIPIAAQNANADLLRNDLVVLMTLQALEKLGVYLGSLPGRKNLVWLAGSFPIDILPNLNPNLANTNGMSANFATDPSGYMTAIRDLAFLLQSGNIVVYPVDVRGLIDTGTFTGSRTGGGGAVYEVQAATQGLTNFALTNGQIQGAMETIASITGGRAYFNTNDISGSIIEAFNDGSNYYSLSYKPTNEHWDGKFRRIEVRVDARDLKLYYREGYYAELVDKPKNPFHLPDPGTGAAMLRGTPEVSEIAFQLHLTPDGAVRTIPAAAPALHKRGAWEDEQLSGPAQLYELDLTIQPSDIQFSTVDGGKYQSDITVSAIAYDAQGKMLNTIAGEFNSPLFPATYTAIMHDALHLYLKPGMELPVGKVYLRVGVRDMRTGKIGAFEIPVDVGTSSHSAH